MRRAEVREEVKDTITERVWRRLAAYVDAHPPALWAEEPPRGFAKDTLMLMLYKDIHAIGYNRLFQMVKDWYGASDKSFRHNIKKMRKCLKVWGRNRIKRGTLADWDRAVGRLEFPKGLEGVNLWIDSEDLALTGKRRVSKKHPSWSYKKNAPGRRYMIIADCRGRIRVLWGGYTPKLHDGNFLELKRNWIERKLKGGEVVGDQAFRWGQQNLEKVKFHVPMKKSSKRRRKGQTQREKKREDQLMYRGWKKQNSGIYAVRARVENHFGVMQGKFKAMRKPWPESEKQLDCLVFIAAGILNATKG